MRTCPRCDEVFEDQGSFCPHDGAPLDPPGDALVGRVLASRFRLVRRIGASATALTYLARHLLIDRRSALKILRPELALDPSQRERFLREARAVNRIAHRSLVEVRDVGEADGFAYLVLEHVEGERLSERLARGALPWTEAAGIAAELSSALARAHEHGVVHRDVRPENVLLVPQAGRELVKLTDFGAAKMLDQPSLTLTDAVLGTPGYVAPEHAAGRPLDGRADLWALGVVLYEALAGAHPFDAPTPGERLVRSLHEDPPPLDVRVAGLPHELVALVARLLARSPEARPQDAYEVHDALLALLERAREERLDATLAPPAPGAPSAASASASEAKGTSPGWAPPASEPFLPEVMPATPRLEPGSALLAMERLAVRVPTPGARPHGGTGDDVEAAPMSARLAGLDRLLGDLAGRAPAAPDAEVRRAGALADEARGHLVRFDRALGLVAEAQADVTRLETEARAFRRALGRRIDAAGVERARERAHLDALLGALAERDVAADDRAALEAERARAAEAVERIGEGLELLRLELGEKNVAHETAHAVAAGRLEGALAALRTLAGAARGAIEEGVDLARAVAAR